MDLSITLPLSGDGIQGRPLRIHRRQNLCKRLDLYQLLFKRNSNNTNEPSSPWTFACAVSRLTSVNECLVCVAPCLLWIETLHAIVNRAIKECCVFVALMRHRSVFQRPVIFGVTLLEWHVSVFQFRIYVVALRVYAVSKLCSTS